MKRTTLLFLLLCFAFIAWAEPIGKQAALYTAQSYMMTKGKSINIRKSPFKAGRKSISQTEGEAYYYIFNVGNDNGYVIVSGDDRVEPILGYVDQGSFDPDNIPENMRSWLQFYADEIKYVIDNGLRSESPILKQRNKVRGTKHSVPELMKSRWNQGTPYNLTCPKYYKENGTQASPATGCAATAMAQVINFYKYPEKTKAVIPAISKTYKLSDGTEKTVTTNAIPSKTVIDWENIRDTYSWESGHQANAQDSAVANLMYYCGQSLKMGYGASSSADTSKSRNALVSYFGFDECAFWASRSNYGIDEWFDMLYDELNAGYPVLYRGHSSGGGHAFVIDGFDGENLFHVNWGWGGSSNGYFLIGILNPGDTSGTGASSSSDGYSMTQGAVFNLRIPGKVKESRLDVSDLTVSNKTYLKATFKNSTGSGGRFDVAVVRYNEKGELTLVGKKLTTTTISDGATQIKSFQISKQLPEGTYRLAIACKHTSSENWKLSYNLPNKYIEAVVDADSIPTLNIVNPTYNVDISVDTIVFPGTRIVGKEQEVKVTFKNNADEYFKVLYFFASKTQTKTYTDSKSMVAIRKGESVDVSYFFTPKETGTYNLWFCTDDKGSNVVAQGTMEVITEAEAEKADLTASSFTITNGSGEVVYGKRFVGKISIKNNKTKDFHGNIKLELWVQKIGSNTASHSTSRSYQIDVNAGKTTSIDFDFDNLNTGNYYRFKVLYANQDGNLGSGGLWDHKWEMQDGFLTWKGDGTIVGKAYSSNIASTVTTTICGLYADCSSRISKIMPSRTNPNAIYALGTDMEIPASIDTCNAVKGNHAKHIKLVNDKPYYLPVSFEADSASFTYTFPETEPGTGWHTFTMPFDADSILVDGVPVLLDDCMNHFWIYEFAAQGDNGEVIFAPATVLRGRTPYIIAGDATMAGRSIEFRSLNASFFKTGSDKMVVTSPDYTFHGCTLSPKLKDCYMLNAAGTAFDYVTTTTTLTGQGTYFTTDLSAENRLASIVLPDLSVLKAELADLENSIKRPTSTASRNGVEMYDLSGRRIANGQKPKAKGIYIVNGKKVAVK